MNEYQKFMAIQASVQSEYLACIAWILSTGHGETRGRICTATDRAAEQLKEHAPSFIPLVYKV